MSTLTESKEQSEPQCTPSYDTNDHLQQEVSRLLASLQYDIMGIISLGKDGITRSLTADRKVLCAVPFSETRSRTSAPAQLTYCSTRTGERLPSEAATRVQKRTSEGFGIC